MGRTLALEVNDVHDLLDLVDENLSIAVAPRHFRYFRRFRHKLASLAAIALKGSGDARYETVALRPSSQATSPARALITLLETGGLATPPDGAHHS